MNHLKFPQSLHTRRAAFQPLSNGGTSLQLIFNKWPTPTLAACPLLQSASWSSQPWRARKQAQHPSETWGEEISRRHLQADDDNSSFMGQLDLGVTRWHRPQLLTCFLLQEALGSLTHPGAGHSPAAVQSWHKDCSHSPHPKCLKLTFPDICPYVQCSPKSWTLSASRDTLPTCDVA